MYEGMFVGGITLLITPIVYIIVNIFMKEGESKDELILFSYIMSMLVMIIFGVVLITAAINGEIEYQELTINNCISENDNCDICYDKLHNNISNLFDKLAKREECNVFQQNTKLFTGGE